MAHPALAVDAAAINGSGSANQPLGLLRTTGIGSVALSGAAPTYDSMVNLETAVADGNADTDSMKFLTTPTMRGTLRKAPILASNGASLPTWENISGSPGMGSVIGYPAAVSKQVPQNLGGSQNYHAIILGSWPDMLIGEWGVLELVVDPYTLKKQGMIEVTSFQMVDVFLRHPARFAATQDAGIA